MQRRKINLCILLLFIIAIPIDKKESEEKTKKESNMKIDLVIT